MPAHYEEIGRILQYFAKPKAAIIQLNAPLRVGERIAFERAVLFHEEVVSGIQVNNENVVSAAAGDEIGVVSSLPKSDARPGVRVFRVKADW